MVRRPQNYPPGKYAIIKLLHSSCLGRCTSTWVVVWYYQVMPTLRALFRVCGGVSRGNHSTPSPAGVKANTFESTVASQANLQL